MVVESVVSQPEELIMRRRILSYLGLELVLQAGRCKVAASLWIRLHDFPRGSFMECLVVCSSRTTTTTTTTTSTPEESQNHFVGKWLLRFRIIVCWITTTTIALLFPL
jgi:hypothetical protein